MNNSIEGKVVVITGASSGMGEAAARHLAAHGAAVVLGARRVERLEGLAGEIVAAGGKALAVGTDVTRQAEVQRLVDAAVEAYGRIDVLINNAGILRDKSFVKMTQDDWDKVVAVHLTGSQICSKAVWPIMREQGYGRIVMTTSTSGLYGNFGQANYGAAKTAVAGLMNTLCLEGEKYNIKVNCIAPTAATRMTEDLMPPEVLAMLEPKEITPAVLFLASTQAPTHRILLAGAGCYAMVRLMESEGVYLSDEERNVDGVAAHFEQIGNMDNASEMMAGGDHVTKILTMAAKAKGIKLG